MSSNAFDYRKAQEVLREARRLNEDEASRDPTPNRSWWELYMKSIEDEKMATDGKVVSDREKALKARYAPIVHAATRYAMDVEAGSAALKRGHAAVSGLSAKHFYDYDDDDEHYYPKDDAVSSKYYYDDNNLFRARKTSTAAPRGATPRSEDREHQLWVVEDQLRKLKLGKSKHPRVSSEGGRRRIQAIRHYLDTNNGE